MGEVLSKRQFLLAAASAGAASVLGGEVRLRVQQYGINAGTEQCIEHALPGAE